MLSFSLTQEFIEQKALELVPRMKDQGYSGESVERRRAWVEQKTGCQLKHVGALSISSEEMRGNIENPIGAAQMPLGVAGPLRVNGMHADGIFYVPLATTEGALVRSYERGMAALTRAGGATTRLHIDENQVAPVFCFDDVSDAYEFVWNLHEGFEAIRTVAESTTRHGKLLRIECHPVGREVIVNFSYNTADAQGMNMIVKATEHACKWIMDHSRAKRFYVFSGFSSEKRASGSLLAGGKGKTVRHVATHGVGSHAGKCHWLQRALCQRPGRHFHRVRSGCRQHRQLGGWHNQLRSDGGRRPLRERHPALADSGDGGRRHRIGNQSGVSGNAWLYRQRLRGQIRRDCRGHHPCRRTFNGQRYRQR